MYSVDWFSQYIKNWEIWLAEFKGKPNLKFLEIGCFEGKATVWLLENILTHTTSKIYTIDTFGGGMEDGDKGAYFSKDAEKNYIQNIAPFRGKVITYRGVSQEVLRNLWFEAPDFDFIYVDGSHRSPEVLEDIVLSWGMLKKNGLMICDDYKLERYPEPLLNPKMGIDAFFAINKGKYRLINNQSQLVVVKTV